MTTSGTTSFDLPITVAIEEAFERCGAEARSGYDLLTATRSLSLMFVDWANRGINLFLVDGPYSIPMVQGTITYDLPVDTIDLLDCVIRTGTGVQQMDININRISESTYLSIPTKNSQGRPVQVWVNRQTGATYPTATAPYPSGVNYPTINVWPAPDQSSFYTFVYYRLRRIQDPGTGSTTQDIPFRFLNAMVAGLAYHLSIKLPNIPPERIQMLKMDYAEQLQLAMDEDREKSSCRWVPRIRGVR